MIASKTSLLLLLSSLSSSLVATDAFASSTRARGSGTSSMKPAFTTSSRTSQTRSTSASSLPMLPKQLMTSLLEISSRRDGSTSTSTSPIALPMFLTSMAPALGLTSGASAVGFLEQQPLVDPVMEAHILNDMSHLGLDLAGYFVPGMLVLRVAAIVGRLCTMAADYVPDHTIVPEEFLFQLCMLTAAWVGLMKAALLPAFSATAKSVTVKDGRAYTALFAPAGTTWANFKALSVCALDWITVEAGEMVTTDETDAEDEYIYWLYSGNVQVESAGTPLYTVSRQAGAASKQDAGRGLLGERRLLRRLERNIVKTATDNTNYPRTTVRVSSTQNEPATLLRIHTPSLKMLMDHDVAFAESIRTLLFQGMEAKLHAQLQETSSLMKAFNVTALA